MYSWICAGFILLSLNVAVYCLDSTEGCIWRDFNGTIPPDAFPAGSDIRGLVYIGQVPFEGQIVPGKLYEGDTHIYFEFGEQARKKAKHIKILCTDNLENFQWMYTKTSDFLRIKEHKLVIGGYQPEFKTYIGKVIKGGMVDVGKVICREDYCLALYTWNNGKYVEYQTYYVLTYTPPPTVIYFNK